LAKIVHLTSVHQALDIRIYHKECKSLARAGHEVVLIAPHDRPLIADGVRLRPVPKPRGRRERMTRTVWQVYRAALQENADVYHFHDPELIPIGLLLKLQRGQVVYDVHEDRPRQMMSKHWIPPQMRRPVSWLVHLTEAASGRVWDGIVAATPAIRRLFPGDKTVVVQNFPILDELDATAAIPYAERRAVIAYVGNLTAIRGAREMVQSVGLLPEGLSPRLELAGTFDPPELKDELRSLPGWERVRFFGWLSRPEIAELLGRARVGLALLHPTGNYLEAQPNKLFEYMATGIPFVASDFPHWRKLVNTDRSGLLVDPTDPTAISDAILWLLEHPKEAEAMGMHGQEAVRTRFHWQPEAQQLVDFYRIGLGRPT
jgi:glycosyltransferase involved in cell wall biosynthesis